MPVQVKFYELKNLVFRFWGLLLFFVIANEGLCTCISKTDALHPRLEGTEESEFCFSFKLREM